MKPKTLILTLALVGIALDLYFHSLMPAKVAAHFDLNGTPNGWMSKDVLLFFNIGMYLLFSAMFTLIPVQWMNFPNKSYWLAPERAKQTEELVLEMYTKIGAATIAFLIAMTSLVYRANLSSRPQLGAPFFILLVAFVAYTIFWSIRFYAKFSKTQ